MPVRWVRRRYLHFTVSASETPTGADIEAEIKRSVKNLYGVMGMSEIDPVLICFNEEDRSGILRCSHSGLRCLRAALALITDISKNPAAIRVSRASGTIKRLKMKTSEGPK